MLRSGYCMVRAMTAGRKGRPGAAVVGSSNWEGNLVLIETGRRSREWPSVF